MKTAHLAAGLALLLVLAGTAGAHNIGAECKLRGQQVEVEAFYDDDTAAKNARVEVLDVGQKTIASGRTDAQGRWTFPTPEPGVYQVIVDAGAGHRTTVKVTVPGTKPAAEAREPDAARTVSEGSSREEFTRFPWLRVALGLGIIVVLSLVLWLALTRLRTNPGPSQNV